MVFLPHCWTAATCVAIMLLPMLFSAACSSILFGIISDRTSRRKPIVITAGMLLLFSNVIEMLRVLTREMEVI